MDQLKNCNKHYWIKPKHHGMWYKFTQKQRHQYSMKTTVVTAANAQQT